jgi:hypothetical protein
VFCLCSDEESSLDRRGAGGGVTRAADIARRSAASKRGAETRRRQAAMRAFMANGTPIPDGGTRGTGPREAGEKMGFNPAAIVARIKAREGQA